MFFWKNKKKEEDKDRKDEFFIKIALTEDEKLNIYVGWPKVAPEKVQQFIYVLLFGILHGGFSKNILDAFEGFDNPQLDGVLKKYYKNISGKKNYISPLDVHKQ